MSIEDWEAPQTISAGWVYGQLDPKRAYTGKPRPGAREIEYVRADLHAGAVNDVERAIMSLRLIANVYSTVEAMRGEAKAMLATLAHYGGQSDASPSSQPANGDDR